MRAAVCIPLLGLLAVQAAAAQTVSCRLAPSQYEYVFRGWCRADSAQPRGGSFWPADSVSILMAAGPREAPPWRGNISLPGWELSFEVARETPEPGRSRVVLRTAFFWLMVSEWRQTEADTVVLAFGLDDSPPPTLDDVAILSAALSRLDSIAVWDREDDRDCTNDAAGAVSLFCVLHAAIEAHMGRYHHRQPALDTLRAVLMERWPNRMNRHPVMDLNNDPATTMDDLRAALRLALDVVREQMK